MESTAKIQVENRLLTTQESANYVGLGVHRLEKLRISGGGPEFIKLGRSVRYERAALDAWIAASRRRSTSEAKA
ncbi:helix-turn-helix transcriptional regulator [Methylorubrum podarium]|uniref:helix-turn-helix transcriptional regulator n=1 Tax=Methylorubrum podarium TaxID=200476 RepID=UPI0035A222FB